MQVKLPMTGFVPGQWIEIFLDIKDTTELKKISVKLQQVSLRIIYVNSICYHGESKDRSKSNVKEECQKHK